MNVRAILLHMHHENNFKFSTQYKRQQVGTCRPEIGNYWPCYTLSKQADSTVVLVAIP